VIFGHGYISPNSTEETADRSLRLQIRYGLLNLQNRYIWLPFLRLTPPPPTEGILWDDLRKILTECQLMAKVPNGEKTLPKISTGCMSMAHERYRQTEDDRRTVDSMYIELKREMTFAKHTKV